MKPISAMIAASAMALVLSNAAYADACSGHRHTTGTVLGATGGGIIGAAVTHGSPLGIIGGAVLGGVTGNAVARSNDCDRHYRHRYYHTDAEGHRHYYYR
ncbi:MAG TPA: glycine zipper 2TM domain-containing protein [Rhizomicrobium sp.]